ncbi:hypothetical protein [Microbacterium sp. YJN-G]|uniref:hypothetical protein n=1 Tax=Microbacterium sp. YJN-G TaxID=2763257 RepID=UPI0018777A34|nr:hypothetical protein [Microbacterium sp. YJN-G]
MVVTDRAAVIAVATACDTPCSRTIGRAGTSSGATPAPDGPRMSCGTSCTSESAAASAADARANTDEVPRSKIDPIVSDERADAAAALTPINSVIGCSSSLRRLSSRLDSRTRSAKRTDMAVSDPRPAGRTLTIEMS